MRKRRFNLLGMSCFAQEILLSSGRKDKGEMEEPLPMFANHWCFANTLHSFHLSQLLSRLVEMKHGEMLADAESESWTDVVPLVWSDHQLVNTMCCSFALLRHKGGVSSELPQHLQLILCFMMFHVLSSSSSNCIVIIPQAS